MPDEFDVAATRTAEASDAVETAVIHLAVLEEQLSVAKDVLAALEAHVRTRTPLLGKNAEDRDAEFLLRLRQADGWQAARDEVFQCIANVETQRAAVERARMRRQELLWGMRYIAGLGSSPTFAPADEL